MIIRVIFVLFFSFASAVCYLAGYGRIMSALLILLGALASALFGVLFVVPETGSELWFPVYGDGAGWPYFLLAMLLFAMSVYTVFSKWKGKSGYDSEQVSSLHVQNLFGGVLAYVVFIFIASYFWFPSEARRTLYNEATLENYVLFGTILFLAGEIAALYLFYLASKGGLPRYPDMMRRVVLTLFTFLHFDKIPIFIAFLLVYSPEAQVIYPGAALLAMTGYLPISVFLFWLSKDTGDTLV